MAERILDVHGEQLAGTEQQYIIGRESFDLAFEVYDTRIAPGEVRQIAYKNAIPHGFDRLEVEFIVDPDHWYRRFYKNMPASNSAGRGTALIQQAYLDSAESIFTLYRESWLPIPADGGHASASPISR